MKKLLLSLLVGASTLAFAQKNISLTLVNPAEGGTIQNQTPFNVQMTIKNEGTETVTTQDTILVFFLINGNFIATQTGPLVLRIIPSADIASGASNNYNLNNLSIGFNQGGEANF